MTTVINSWNSVDGGTVTAIAQPTIEEPLKVHVNAEQYMLHKYGAFRGHFAWREIQSAYAQGQLDAAIAQPAPVRQPLTHTEITNLWDSSMTKWVSQRKNPYTQFARAVEAAHGIAQPKDKPASAWHKDFLIPKDKL